MILFYRRGALGDTLLTFPVLEILKRRGKRILAVGNVDYFNIAKQAGWVDEINYEIPHMDFEKVIKVSVDGDVKPFPERRVWIVDHYLESLGLKDIYSRLLNMIPLKDNPLRGKAVIHPSSGSARKNPQIELFLRIEEYLKKHGYEVIYLIGEADKWVKKYVSRIYESENPTEMAKALSNARLFVGNDSGVSHLASYVGVPSFIFYGPTDPLVWKPIGEKVYQISLNLPCSPCFPYTCQERLCLNTDTLFKSFIKAIESLMI